jgi:purine-binding chemotaxis protein CheW
MNQLTTTDDKKSKTGVAQYLTFQAGDETFAIEILDVKEIIEIEAITKVPMMPAFIVGIINLRGRVVPVVDLSKRLGRRSSIVTKKSCIVLVEVNHDDDSQPIGMMVDEVDEILEIAESHTQPAPDFGTDLRTDFIRAMGRVDEKFIVLLDVNHVLSVDDISALSHLEDSQSAAPAEEQ